MFCSLIYQVWCECGWDALEVDPCQGTGGSDVRQVSVYGMVSYMSIHEFYLCVCRNTLVPGRSSCILLHSFPGLSLLFSLQQGNVSASLWCFIPLTSSGSLGYTLKGAASWDGFLRGFFIILGSYAHYKSGLLMRALVQFIFSRVCGN